MKVVRCVLFKNFFFTVFLIIAFLVNSSELVSAQEQKNNSFPQKTNSTIIEDTTQIIVNTQLISFNVSVTDIDGFAVTGLGKQDFSIFDNKTPQEIHFFSDEDSPASISIILDTSGSMSGDKIIQAKQALGSFIQTSKNQDEFFLIDVGSKANLLFNGTRDSDALLEKFTYVSPKGNTALYDAVNLGAKKASRGSYSKKIVLVISDGEDNNSRLSFKTLKNSLKESNVIIYSIGIGGYLPYVSKGISGRDILKELSKVSGGKAFFPNNLDEMNDTFDRIALDIRHLYSIGYYPTNLTADGKNHHVMVKVKTPDEQMRLFVNSRKEYKPDTNLTTP